MVFNPGEHFDRTKSGKILPTDSPHDTLIVDKQDRVLVLSKIDGMPNLSWLLPIQPTTVEDIEQNRLVSRNRRFAANVIDRCFEAHDKMLEISDGPTVDDYKTKVQNLLMIPGPWGV